MSDTRAILEACAASSGLAPAIEPFCAKGSLAQRLAHNPFLMAPMAGVSDAAYRIMARAGGAALAYSEMVSVTGIHYRSEKTWELVEPEDLEPDIAVQLFGSDCDHFAEAVEKVCAGVGDRLALIDINMACPVPKVTKGGAGSALLDEPELAARIVRTCVGTSSVPVTVKIRRGRRMGEEVAPDFARAMADAGACAIAVHGRYANQMYRGEADWDVVTRVASAVDVPVIGSGDVRGAGEAVRMLRECGCTAVMVARGTYGNPWVFGQARSALAGSEIQAPSASRRIEAFCEHVRLLDATGAHMARGRSLAGWYLRGLPRAAYWRGLATACVTLDDYLELAQRLRAEVGDA
ncbi:MAG: tRNA-dihydrouridine synthase [Coriobacteriales bacterium]|nr:tRNA-dihydrouridine synthase [Coriobacteriales bacterium]